MSDTIETSAPSTNQSDHVQQLREASYKILLKIIPPVLDPALVTNEPAQTGTAAGTAGSWQWDPTRMTMLQGCIWASLATRATGVMSEHVQELIDRHEKRRADRVYREWLGPLATAPDRKVYHSYPHIDSASTRVRKKAASFFSKLDARASPSAIDRIDPFAPMGVSESGRPGSVKPRKVIETTESSGGNSDRETENKRDAQLLIALQKKLKIADTVKEGSLRLAKTLSALCRQSAPADVNLDVEADDDDRLLTSFTREFAHLCYRAPGDALLDVFRSEVQRIACLAASLISVHDPRDFDVGMETSTLGAYAGTDGELARLLEILGTPSM